MFLGRKCGRCVELTLPLSVGLMSKQCGILNISQPYRPSRLVTGMALLYLHTHTYVCVYIYIYIYQKFHCRLCQYSSPGVYWP
jgi:hypothetical protein